MFITHRPTLTLQRHNVDLFRTCRKLTSSFLCLSVVMSECSLSGRGQSHVSSFYIVDLKHFATASRWYTGDIHNSVRSRFVYDIYRTVEATRSRHG